MKKEFVLVSQGIEIMRTESQEKAINYVKKSNDEWFDYKQKCIDNYEDYADNYIDLEIEYKEEKNINEYKLKIKDDVDLKELEKFGYRKISLAGNTYYIKNVMKDNNSKCWTYFESIYINAETRVISSELYNDQMNMT